MGTDPVLTAMAFHQCGKDGCRKASMRDGFMSCGFQRGEVIGLDTDTVPVSKQM